MVISSCCLPYLKQDGYEVHVLTNERGKNILSRNPNISEFIHFEDNCVPIEELGDYYDEMGKDYDKTVVLSGSIEGRYLFPYPDERYFWPVGKRRKECLGKNYYDETIRQAGYEPNGLRTGQLFFSHDDIIFARNFRQKHRKDFVILWALAGSSTHKGYLHYEEVAREVLKKIPRSFIIAAGTFNEMVLSFQHERVWNTGFEEQPIMRIFALTKFVDLVIGPESSIINASGCFDTPKICLLSHSSRQNATATFRNDFSLEADCACSPCHILHKYAKWFAFNRVCMVDKEIWGEYGMMIPACTGEGHGKVKVYDRIMEVYRLKKQGVL